MLIPYGYRVVASMSNTENAKTPDSEEKSKDGDQGFLADIWELARIPIAFAILAAGFTWAVWYYTAEPGRPESEKPAGCSWLSWNKCISPNVLNRMVTHGGIAGGFGSIWSYVMITRERRAREAAERELALEREARRKSDRLIDQLTERILELTRPNNSNGDGEQGSPPAK